MKVLFDLNVVLDVVLNRQPWACCGQPLADLECSEDGEQIEIETTVSRRVVRRKRYRRT